MEFTEINDGSVENEYQGVVNHEAENAIPGIT
jgi:hypothetical protein